MVIYCIGMLFFLIELRNSIWLGPIVATIVFWNVIYLRINASHSNKYLDVKPSTFPFGRLKLFVSTSCLQFNIVMSLLMLGNEIIVSSYLFLPYQGHVSYFKLRCWLDLDESSCIFWFYLM